MILIVFIFTGGMNETKSNESTNQRCLQHLFLSHVGSFSLPTQSTLVSFDSIRMGCRRNILFWCSNAMTFWFFFFFFFLLYIYFSIFDLFGYSDWVLGSSLTMGDSFFYRCFFFVVVLVWCSSNFIFIPFLSVRPYFLIKTLRFFFSLVFCPLFGFIFLFFMRVVVLHV